MFLDNHCALYEHHWLFKLKSSGYESYNRILTKCDSGFRPGFSCTCGVRRYISHLIPNFGGSIPYPSVSGCI